MPNTITLKGVEYVLGDLTVAVYEDFPDAYDAFMRFRDADAFLRGDHLRAMVTFGAEAVRRGGHPEMTREAFRELLRAGDLLPLYVAVSDAMGLPRKKASAAPGEAPSPEGSPPSATSSGA